MYYAGLSYLIETINYNSTIVQYHPQSLCFLSNMRYNYRTFTFGGEAQCSVHHVEQLFLPG